MAQVDGITLYLEDANGTLYLAERVGWRSDTGRVGIVKVYDEDEPIFCLVTDHCRECGHLGVRPGPTHSGVCSNWRGSNGTS